MPNNLHDLVEKGVESGKSLNKIVAETGLPKTTIYYYFRKIKGPTVKAVKVNFNNESDLGEFLGVFAGDGNFYLDTYRYRISFCLNINEKIYLHSLADFLTKAFSKKPMIFIDSKYNRVYIRYYSKTIYNFLKKFLAWDDYKTATIRLKGKIRDYNTNFLVGFLRGLIDTDGSISKNRISYGTVSKKLAKQVEEILKIIKIKHSFYVVNDKRKNRLPMFHFSVHGENSSILNKLINPRNPSHSLRV